MAVPMRALLRKARGMMEKLEKATPEIEAFEKKEDKQTVVKFFEGVQGYKTVLEDTLEKPGITIHGIGSVGGRWESEYGPRFLEDYIRKRIKLSIRRKQITFPEDPKTGFVQGSDPKILRETRYLPQEFYYPSSLIIYRNKVAFFSSKPELNITLIESEDIADAELKKFNFIWSFAKE